jgi:hypothetical protein
MVLTSTGIKKEKYMPGSGTEMVLTENKTCTWPSRNLYKIII